VSIRRSRLDVVFLRKAPEFALTLGMAR